MSFELKPQIQISATTSNVDQILWTVPRDPLPILLKGRVPQHVWTKTFDAVYGYYEDYLHKARSMMPWIFVPCFVPCTMPWMIKVARDYRDGWVEILQVQQKIYRQYGIQVSLAKEARSFGTGSDRNMRMEIVGLRFDIGQMPDSNAYSRRTNNQTNLVDGGSLTDKLAKLDHLHKAGALSDEEFRQAKQKVLDV